jgi:feruloyl esterase
VAAYTGEGDWTDAANWKRGEAAQVVETRDWPGADLFAPYAFSDR